MQVFEFENKGDSTHVEEFNQELVRSEHQLESWLHSHPEVLLDEPILIIGRQSNFGSGPIDLLALDQFGNTLIFELKKGDTVTGSTSEDKIIGQPLRYAEAVDSCGYDELNETYQEYQNEIASGMWNLDGSVAPGDNLIKGFETAFGRSLDSTEFNEHQRIIIVAEHVTRQTAASAHYLLDGGLNVQCREIQLFSPPDEESGLSMLAASTVVDYNLGRVRPEQRGNPTYPDVVRKIIERAFPEIQKSVHSQTLSEVFPKFDQREPGPQSNHPNHPDSIRYYIRPVPVTGGRIRIGIEVRDIKQLPAVRECADEFERRGFTFNPQSTRYQVIDESWEVESVESLEREEFLDEIAKRYVDLVKLGHEVLTENY